MKNIAKVEMELESICPLLMDRFDEEQTAKTDEEYKKGAEKKVYGDGKSLYIPANAVKACIRLASSELGKKMDGKKNRQSIRAGIFFENEFYLNKKTHDGIVKHIVTRGQGDKVTRVPSYRPIINKWKCKNKASLIGVTPDFVKQALELGGLKYGLLSYRPEFGRFIVKSFKVIK